MPITSMIPGGSGLKIAGAVEGSALFGDTIKKGDAVIVKANDALEYEMLPDTGVLPPEDARICAISADGKYLAITTIYVTGQSRVLVYRIEDGVFTKLAAPTDLIITSAFCCALSSDGTYLAIGSYSGAQEFVVYKRNGDTFTKLFALAEHHVINCEFSLNDQYLAVACRYKAPVLRVYRRTGDVFSKIPDPEPTDDSGGRLDCSLSKDGLYLAAVNLNTHQLAKRIFVYERAGNSYVSFGISDLPNTIYAHSCSFHPDGIYLAVGHTEYPYLTIYKRSDGTFEPLPTIDDPPNGLVNSCAFSPDGSILIAGSEGYPYITIYKCSGDIFTKAPNPDVLPPSSATDCSISEDGTYISVAHAASPYISIYKKDEKAGMCYKSDNGLPDLSNIDAAGYALESGIAGETKRIMKIWQ